MLDCFKGKSKNIKSVYRENDALIMCSDAGTYKIEAKSEDIFRIIYTESGEFSKRERLGIVDNGIYREWTFEENEEDIVICLPEINLVVKKSNGQMSFFDPSKSHMKTPLFSCGEEISFEEFTTTMLSDMEQETTTVKTADGEKKVVKDPVKIETGKSYHIRMSMELGDEAIYGLGQHEEGLASLRGNRVYVHQANKKIAIPFFLSTSGYGLLLDTYSPMIFNDTAEGTYLYAEAMKELDFYFIFGGNPKETIKGYRQLTGKATMLPKWAFGHIQSQERYETADEVVSIAKTSREKGFGIDAVVLDWMSWEDGRWGQKSFDKKRFSDPKKMTDTLHDMHTHFMISIWPNMDESTDNYKEFKQADLLLPCHTTYNAFKKEARELYWKQVKKGLFDYGIDSWWCDSSEAFTPEWNRLRRPESSRMYEEFCKTAALHMPEEYTNSFSLYHAMSIYEGQRGSDEKKRVFNLTRSAYTGQQRYGNVFWSGDISASWEVFRKQIAAGLHFCASGLPYWTVDVGAFFVKKGDAWYWNGDFDKCLEDDEYKELFVRMYQWACFLPICRVHGTDCRRELWKVGEEGDKYYEALKKTNKLRYRLLPHIYSQAGKVWLEDESMMTLLAMEYPRDKDTWGIVDEYMFCESMLVCPVTAAGAKSRMVYLPKGNKWVDFYTKKVYDGGQWIEVCVDIDSIPVFVKEGSIICFSEPALSSEELTGVTHERFGEGTESYVFYEDDGDGYGYEKDEYTLTELS